MGIRPARTIPVTIIVIMVLSLVVGACGGATPTATRVPATLIATPTTTAAKQETPTPVATPTKQPAPTPTAGRKEPAGELNLASGEGDSALTLVSTQSPVNARLWQQLQFEWLVDRDEKGNLAPGLATQWKLSGDLKYWEFALRKGVKFQDGQEMTADDWVAMQPLYKAGKGGSAPKIANQVIKWEAPDPYTLRLYTKAPDVTFVDQTSRNGIISLFASSRKSVQEKGVEYWAQHPIGTGPYVFVDRKPGASVTYQVTPEASRGDHWRVKNPGFAKVTVGLVLESTTRVAMLVTGKADIVDVNPSQKAQVADRPGITITRARDVMTNGIKLCCQGKPGGVFNDIRVRKALNLAVNVDQIVDKMYQGEASRIAYWGVTPGVLGYLPSMKPYPYDLPLAKQLMKEAGFPPAGFTLEIYESSRPGSADAEATEAVVSSWKAAGIDVQMRLVDSYAVYVDKLKDMSFTNKAFTGFNTNSREPSAVWQAAMGCNERFQPILGYRATCDVVDDWIGQYLAESDAAKREALATKVQTWLWESYGLVPLVAKHNVYAYGPKVGEFKPVDNIRYWDKLELVQPAR